MYTTLLVPLDGSKRAESALPHAVNLAAQFGARVVLLKVTGQAPLLERDEVIDAAEYLRKRRQQEQESRSYLKQIGNRFGDSASDIKIVIQSGAVVQEIIRAAQTEKADMVIMASHGWSGGRRNFYGSVVSGVLNQIDRPLLLIRSRMAE
jgi:nucleotide-binding universal stress UspA family protein